MTGSVWIRRTTAIAILLALIAVASAMWSLLDDDQNAAAWRIGPVDDFPVGSPIPIAIDHGYFDLFEPEGGGEAAGAVKETRVWVVNRTGARPLVLLQRSPWKGCRVMLASPADASNYGHTPPQGFEVGFIDPCHGGLYALDGRHLEGPGTAHLSRFEVGIDGDGRLLIDLTDLRGG